MTASSIDWVDPISNIEAPRVDRTKWHSLTDILFLCVACTIAGCDGPSDLESFARTQLKWCRKFIALINGVPSHDTIGRVIALIKPEPFQAAFLDWIAAITASDAESTEPNFIPVDGKTVRGSGGGSSRENPLHLVSAWATQQGMTLGQVAVDSKSNEITALPKLLKMLELKNAVGRQKKIAKQIVDNDGDYVLAVEDNHPKLAQAISDFLMDRCEEEDFAEFGCRKHEVLEEKSRGRRESRYFTM